MPQPNNEPILGFAPGSQERADLQAEMDRQMGEVIEIPCIINGKEVFTEKAANESGIVEHSGHELLFSFFQS